MADHVARKLDLPRKLRLSIAALAGALPLTFALTLESNAVRPPGPNSQPDSQGPSFLEALKEQLGLKLTPTKAPLNVLIVDHIDRPSPN